MSNVERKQMSKVEEKHYKYLKDKVDFFKKHYENLFFILLSVTAGFISLSIYVLGDYSIFFEKNFVQILKNLSTLIPTLVIIFGGFVLACWVFHVILRLIGKFIADTFRTLKNIKNRDSNKKNIIKTIISIILFIGIATLITFSDSSKLLNLLKLYIIVGLVYSSAYYYQNHGESNGDREGNMLIQETLSIIVIFGTFSIIFPGNLLYIFIIFIYTVLIMKIIDISYKLIHIHEAMEIIIMKKDPTYVYYENNKEMFDELEKIINKIREKPVIPLIRLYIYHPLKQHKPG